MAPLSRLFRGLCILSYFVHAIVALPYHHNPLLKDDPFDWLGADTHEHEARSKINCAADEDLAGNPCLRHALLPQPAPDTTMPRPTSSSAEMRTTLLLQTRDHPPHAAPDDYHAFLRFYEKELAKDKGKEDKHDAKKKRLLRIALVLGFIAPILAAGGGLVAYFMHEQEDGKDKDPALWRAYTNYETHRVMNELTAENGPLPPADGADAELYRQVDAAADQAAAEMVQELKTQGGPHGLPANGEGPDLYLQATAAAEEKERLLESQSG